VQRSTEFSIIEVPSLGEAFVAYKAEDDFRMVDVARFFQEKMKPQEPLEGKKVFEALVSKANLLQGTPQDK
jgi:hypothetical protein